MLSLTLRSNIDPPLEAPWVSYFWAGTRLYDGYPEGQGFARYPGEWYINQYYSPVDFFFRVYVAAQ